MLYSSIANQQIVSLIQREDKHADGLQVSEIHLSHNILCNFSLPNFRSDDIQDPRHSFVKCELKLSDFFFTRSSNRIFYSKPRVTEKHLDKFFYITKLFRKKTKQTLFSLFAYSTDKRICKTPRSLI